MMCVFIIDLHYQLKVIGKRKSKLTFSLLEKVNFTLFLSFFLENKHDLN